MLVEERSWIGATRWAEEHVVGRLPEHTDDWITELVRLSEGGGVMIPCVDRATEMVVRERFRIPASLLSFESRASAHLNLMDKSSLYEIAERAGVRYPRTRRLADRSQFEEVAADASFPCLIKPVHSHKWRTLLGERRAIVVNDPDDLVVQTSPALEAGLEVLVSEHIPGPDSSLEGAFTIRDADGDYVLICGRRKIRMHPPGYGAAAIDESAQVPETVEMSRRLLDSAGFVGVSSSEFKRHAETGERFLIEVNVRVTQAWGLTDIARTDGSWRLYSKLAGLPLAPRPSQKLGVRGVIPSLELRAVPTHLAERRLSVREVLAGYRGVRGCGGLTPRDPKPLLRLVADYAKWLWGHATRRLRRSSDGC